MTRVTVDTSPVVRAQAIVIGVVESPAGPVPARGADAVDGMLGGGPAGVLSRLGMTGAEGETVKIPAPAGIGADVVVAVGLGGARVDAYDAEVLRRAAGVAARLLAGTGRAVLALPTGTAEAAEAVALGGVLGSYTFGSYRSSRDVTAPVGELIIPAAPEDGQAVAAGVCRGTVIGEEVNRARDLVNTPANDLDPESFAAGVRAVAVTHGLDVTVLDENALAEGGFGGILGVGQGSVRPPRLVRIAHSHPDARMSLAFVGKGITYDSGGLSLKPVGFNEIMKRDMAGAAAVFAAVVAAARLGLAVNVTGWLPLAENMPSGSALRPGDVLRMYGGRTVEVLNTDAEGRLVLADALVRAGEERPDLIVDIATLTAAMKMALGHRIFGVLSHHTAFRQRVLEAAARAGEQAWPMPLPAELRGSLASSVADIANVGDRMGGALLAGLFVKEFVPDAVPWAHLDIAGPAFHEGAAYGYTPHGGTGCGARTLIALAQDAAAGALSGFRGSAIPAHVGRVDVGGVPA